MVWTRAIYRCPKKGIEIIIYEKLGEPNQSFQNLELLAICLEKNSHLSGSLDTAKVLKEIPEKDVIEVFI